jgi:rod shape determining protein RodA
LIMLQPDLGTALVFIAILFAMLYMSGVPAKHLLVLLLIGAAASPIAYTYGLKEYQRQRLLIFLDPYKDPTGFGYNVIQSTIAIGSGRLFGKGFLAGSQTQLNFLPEHHTDFIFSVVGEEWGFIGAVVVLALFFTIVWRGLRTAAEARDMYGTLVATGLTTMFLFHVLINVGMNMSAMPVTGIPLPFLSYGGTSLMTNLMAVGIMLNIQARRQKILF